MHNTEKNIFAFSQLGFLIEGFLQRLGLTQGIKNDFFSAIAQSVQRNPWFTDYSIRQSLSAIAHDMLSQKRLQEWLSRYSISENKLPKNVGIIMAGNIPLVGFHDLLCVLVTGSRAVVKLSSKDNILLPTLVKLLCQIDFHFQNRVEFVDKLENVDAVIATGSNNSARYFEAEFGKIPHIFRKNRTSIAVLSGDENDEDLHSLAHDVLDYFGLGCRSVGKIYLPKGFDILRLQNAFQNFSNVREHSLYNDCLRYATAMHQMHEQPFFDFGSCIATYKNDLYSTVGEVFMQEYDSLDGLSQHLLFYKNNLQCVAAKMPVEGLEQLHVLPGFTQRPQLWDYADGVDIMQFLLALS